MMKREKLGMNVSHFGVSDSARTGGHAESHGSEPRAGKALNLGIGPDSDLPLVSLTTRMTPEEVIELFKKGELGSTEVSEGNM